VGVTLARVVAGLRKQHGSVAPPPATTAFELVLWEKVAYLATDEKRARAFAELKRRIGLTPKAILAARPAALREVCATGGAVGIEERARRMHDAAAYVVDAFGGDLDRVLALPLADARRALQHIYGIAEPGADRILLLMRAQRVLPLESNGLRTLQRIGYGSSHRNYTTMYKSVVAAAQPELRNDVEWLIDAHVLLRHHGQEVCKTSAPRCEQCGVQALCSYGRISGV
jgi:endonuclease III